jgi:hypothetical protein
MNSLSDNKSDNLFSDHYDGDDSFFKDGNGNELISDKKPSPIKKQVLDESYN